MTSIPLLHFNLVYSDDGMKILYVSIIFGGLLLANDVVAKTKVKTKKSEMVENFVGVWKEMSKKRENLNGFLKARGLYKFVLIFGGIFSAIVNK